MHFVKLEENLRNSKMCSFYWRVRVITLGIYNHEYLSSTRYFIVELMPLSNFSSRDATHLTYSHPASHNIQEQSPSTHGRDVHSLHLPRSLPSAIHPLQCLPNLTHTPPQIPLPTPPSPSSSTPLQDSHSSHTPNPQSFFIP